MPSGTIAYATSYRYRTAVALGPHRLMLRPRETRNLAITSFELEIWPAARIDWSHDVAGNAIATVSLDKMSDTLAIRSCTRLALNAPRRAVRDHGENS